jgi:hypothetical protein
MRARLMWPAYDPDCFVEIEPQRCHRLGLLSPLWRLGGLLRESTTTPTLTPSPQGEGTDHGACTVVRHSTERGLA